MPLNCSTILIYCALLRTVLARVDERLEEVGDCLVWMGAMYGGAPVLERPLKARKETVALGLPCQLRVRQLMLELAGKRKQAKAGVAVCTCGTVGCVAHIAYKSRSEITSAARANMPEGARRMWRAKISATTPRRKLTDEQVRQIKTSNEPAPVFAKLFGVTKTTIHNVRQQRTYRSYAASPWEGLLA